MAKIVILIGLISGLWFLYRHLTRRGEVGTESGDGGDSMALLDRDPKYPYAAVSIMPGGQPCAAARDLEGQMMLQGEAPPLPLPGCDVEDCRCRYKHQKDRRALDRRAASRPEHKVLLGALGSERRDKSDRRRS